MKITKRIFFISFLCWILLFLIMMGFDSIFEAKKTTNNLIAGNALTGKWSKQLIIYNTPIWYLKLDDNNHQITINGNECKPTKCGIDYCFYCGTPDKIIINGTIGIGYYDISLGKDNITNLEIPKETLNIIVNETMNVGIGNYVPSCARAEWWETGVPVEYQKMYYKCVNENSKCLNIENNTVVDCPKELPLS